MSPVLYMRDSRAIVTHPLIWLPRRKGLQLLSSFLYYFSLSYLDRPSMKVRAHCFLIFIRRFVSVFWDSNFLEFLKLIDSC